ncbi:unnamed protein product, partial [Rangifer tarandus platyrhynchus]|uniref:Uncharacterized protein n=1 Tax=Rangifer tarandus platyrhynchus TaxID=3082113 RepID=A0AC59Z3Y0_RANTA
MGSQKVGPFSYLVNAIKVQTSHSLLSFLTSNKNFKLTVLATESCHRSTCVKCKESAETGQVSWKIQINSFLEGSLVLKDTLQDGGEPETQGKKCVRHIWETDILRQLAKLLGERN